MTEVVLSKDSSPELGEFCEWLLDGGKVSSPSLRLRLVAARQDPAKAELVSALRQLLVTPDASEETGTPAMNQLRKLWRENPEFFDPDRERSRSPRAADKPSVTTESGGSPSDTKPKGVLGKSTWKLHQPYHLPNGSVSIDFRRTVGNEDFKLNDDRDWLYVPFEPSWTEADLKKRDVRLKVNVSDECVLEELRAFDMWIKEQVAERSEELLGKKVDTEEIDGTNLYRSPVYYPDGNYPPSVYISFILKGAQYFLTEFSRAQEQGEAEALGTGTSALNLLCGAADDRKWQGSRVQLQIRPDKIFVYEDKKRDNQKVFVLKFAARTCCMDTLPPENETSLQTMLHDATDDSAQKA